MSIRHPTTLTAQMAELAVAVPQVVAHRLARMALAGPVPSEVDRSEFRLMADEKSDAFAESWQEMAMASATANVAAVFTLAHALWPMPVARRPSALSIASQWQSATMSILGKGLAPVRRRAVANARRLAVVQRRD